jgi:MEMO1 family protein
MADNETPPRKIIIPGQESAAAEGRKPLVHGGWDPPSEDEPADDSEGFAAPADTGAATGSAGSSRIILPPGTEQVEVPEFPRLRPLALVPIRDGERELLLVNDPLGVIQGQPVIALEALGLMQLFDGRTSITDITAALMRENKDIRMGNMVRDFVAQLDEMLMLESPRFEAAYQALRDAYHPLEIRHATFAGRSYPGDRETLGKYLDAHFAAAAGRTPATPAAAGMNGAPTAVLVPHLDPRRAGGTIAQGILPLDDAGKEPLRVVVFGTGHMLYDEMFALTRKHFDTPIGRVTCDTAFVDALADKIGPAAYRAELAHREEHSIEFAALYLRHRFGDRVRIVPILVGGFHSIVEAGASPREDAAFERMVMALRETTEAAKGRTVYLASVDFSHVGPRFGDPSLDDRTQREIEEKDRAAIDAAAKGDADAWFSTIAAHKDSTRICGFGPTYALLRCAEPGPGRLLHYERSDEPDSSFVSVAAMVWP